MEALILQDFPQRSIMFLSPTWLIVWTRQVKQCLNLPRSHSMWLPRLCRASEMRMEQLPYPTKPEERDINIFLTDTMDGRNGGIYLTGVGIWIGVRLLMALEQYLLLGKAPIISRPLTKKVVPQHNPLRLKVRPH